MLSYCVVNTNGRDYLLDCLAAIERTHPEGVEHELLVLDNASDDGSADAVRERHPDVRLFALERRDGQGRERLAAAARRPRGRYCLLLNEDSELHEGATRALLDALEADPGAAAAGAQLLTSEGEPTACAWRLPDIPLGARRRGVQPRPRSRAEHAATGCARWAGCSRARCWCGATPPSRSAGSTRDFFVYSDETDFCRRLHDAGWRILFVPGRARGAPRPARHRRRPRCGAGSSSSTATATSTSASTGCASPGSSGRPAGPGPTSSARAAATVLPGRDPRRYLLHARQELLPGPGRGHPRSGRGTQPRRLPNNVPAPPWSTLTPPNWPRSGRRARRRCSCCCARGRLAAARRAGAPRRGRAGARAGRSAAGSSTG